MQHCNRNLKSCLPSMFNRNSPSSYSPTLIHRYLPGCTCLKWMILYRAGPSPLLLKWKRSPLNPNRMNRKKKRRIKRKRQRMGEKEKERKRKWTKLQSILVNGSKIFTGYDHQTHLMWKQVHQFYHEIEWIIFHFSLKLSLMQSIFECSWPNSGRIKTSFDVSVAFKLIVNLKKVKHICPINIGLFLTFFSNFKFK